MRFFSWASLRRPAARAFVVGLVGLKNCSHPAAGGDNVTLEFSHPRQQQSADQKRYDEASYMIEKFRMTRRIPGMAVEIHKNGRSFYQRGFGTRDRENNFSISQHQAKNAEKLKYKPDTRVNIGHCSIAITNLIYAIIAKQYLSLETTLKEWGLGANILSVFLHPEDPSQPTVIKDERDEVVTLTLNDIFMNRTKCYDEFDRNKPYDETPTNNNKSAYSSRDDMYQMIKEKWKKPPQKNEKLDKKRVTSSFAQMLLPAWLEKQSAWEVMRSHNEPTPEADGPNVRIIDKHTYRKMVEYFLKRFCFNQDVSVHDAEEHTVHHSNMYGGSWYSEVMSEFSNTFYENHSNMLIGVSGLESNVTGLANIGDFFLKNLNEGWEHEGESNLQAIISKAISDSGRVIEASELAMLMYHRPAHTSIVHDGDDADAVSEPYWSVTTTEGFGWKTEIKRCGIMPTAEGTDDNRDSESQARADFTHWIVGKYATIYLSRKNQDASEHTAVVRHADALKNHGTCSHRADLTASWHLAGRATDFSKILSGMWNNVMQELSCISIPAKYDTISGARVTGVDGVTIAITSNFVLTEDVTELCEQLENLYEDAEDTLHNAQLS